MRARKALVHALVTIFVVASFQTLAACDPSADGGAEAAGGESTQAAAPMNTLTAEEQQEGWRLLFDGETTEGWRGFGQDDAPEGWQAVDGALTRVAAGGDLITIEEFDDFELSLEWMVGPAGNSGIFFRATEDVDLIYFGAPEIQVLDDAGHGDGQSRLTAAGSNYGLHPVEDETIVRPAGEWNHVRLVVDGAHVEHWMNGVQVVEYELWSPDWEQRVAESKFAEWPEYGRARSGHIGLQDHGDRVSFRNIKVRELR